MPQSTNSLVRLDVRQELLGEELHNVFYYQVQSPVLVQNLAALWVQFTDEILEYWRQCVSTQVSFIECVLTNLHSGDTYIQNIALNGLRSGEVLPAFVGWGFTLQRSDTSVRNGSKRFAGVCEGDISDGLATTGIRAVLEILAERLGYTLITTFPDNEEFNPVIYSRDVPFLTTYTYSRIVKGVYRRVTTQNSRKTY